MSEFTSVLVVIIRPAAIDIMNVSKSYRGKVRALKDVSLSVAHGEIFGLLGPNGAGKSSLLKVLLTIIRPNSCKGVMLGQAIGDKKTLKKVGYLPENVQFPDYLSGRQVIRYAAGLSGICPKFCKKRESELLGLVGMEDWADRKIRTYSKGMKQRIGLAQALVNDPELVFLDEPTDGVDPQGRKEMRGILKSLRDQGRTIFINSHLLGELEMVCDSVAILNHGEVVKQGRMNELTGSGSGFTIEYEGELPADLEAKLSLRGDIELGVRKLRVSHTSAVELQSTIDQLRAKNVIIQQVVLNKKSLEDLFVETVAGSKSGGISR